MTSAWPEKVGTGFSMRACATQMLATSLLLCCVLAGSTLAQQAPTRVEIWDLKLGTPLTELPDDFTDYACGTGGGPPAMMITGWKDFRRCRPEPNGLREVYFRYDD